MGRSAVERTHGRTIAMTVAFIGLGRMGLPMATNLTEDGIEVIGVDPDDERRQAFERSGGRTASLVEAAAEASVAITMLRTPAQVETVVDDLLPALSEGALIVDMGTTGPGTAREIADRAIDHGVRVIDAPVSGGVEGAEEGTLAVLIGGDAENVSEARPLLAVVGEDVFHLGDVGTGQTAKLCNQLLVGAQLLSISEAFHLGEAADIAPDQLYDVLTSCIGTSGILEQKGHRLVEHDFEPGADVTLQHKDAQLVLELAGSSGTPAYLAATVAQAFAQARKAGLGDHDHFALYELLDG